MKTWGCRAAGAALLCALLSGCAPLLERTYTASEPHSRKYWESEAADTLRAENYQDIVNDLLILIGQHSQEAALRLYDFPDDQTASEQLEAAALEVQQETALGAYAAAYITIHGQAQRGFYEAQVQIAYRRTARQIQSMVTITAFTALPELLHAALTEGRAELVVRPGFWPEDGRERVQRAAEQVRQDRGIPDTQPWLIHYYPGWDSVGIVEIRLAPTRQELEEAAQADAAPLPSAPEPETPEPPEEPAPEPPEPEETVP